MLRLATVLLAVIALIWMFLPATGIGGTEIAFDADGPDPNVYNITRLFGSPLTWIKWDRSWNEAAGYDDSRFMSFNPMNLGIHLLAIVAPLFLFVWLRKSKAATVA